MQKKNNLYLSNSFSQSRHNFLLTGFESSKMQKSQQKCWVFQNYYDTAIKLRKLSKLHSPPLTCLLVSGRHSYQHASHVIPPNPPQPQQMDVAIIPCLQRKQVNIEILSTLPEAQLKGGSKTGSSVHVINFSATLPLRDHDTTVQM